MSIFDELAKIDTKIDTLSKRREQLFATAGAEAGILQVDWMSDQLSIGDEGDLLEDLYPGADGTYHRRIRLMWRRDDDPRPWSVVTGDWGIALWCGRFRVVARDSDGRGIAVRVDDGEVPENDHRRMVAKLRRELQKGGMRARVRDHDVAIVTPTGDELLRGGIFDAFMWLAGMPEATAVEA